MSLGGQRVGADTTVLAAMLQEKAPTTKQEESGLGRVDWPLLVAIGALNRGSAKCDKRASALRIFR